jgi:hypothetical protein
VGHFLLLDPKLCLEASKTDKTTHVIHLGGGGGGERGDNMRFSRSEKKSGKC